MIIQTTRKIISIVLAELVVLAPRALPLPSLPLTVSRLTSKDFFLVLKTNRFLFLDSKQARDLVAVLQEAKQQIDPRLHEMTRYGGGGGGGRYGGRGYGRGGGGSGGGHRGRF